MTAVVKKLEEGKVPGQPGNRARKKQVVMSEPNRAQLQALRMATVSEVYWFMVQRGVEAGKIVRVMGNMMITTDWLDSWWRGRVNVSIGEWIRFLADEGAFDAVRQTMDRQVGSNCSKDAKEER